MSDFVYEYSDYHRTIIGYHGTSMATAEQLVNGEPFTESDRDDEWFGKGIYFWEYAPKQAWWWASTFKEYREPAVIGAIIRLGNCFDLLDPKIVNDLSAIHDQMVRDLVQAKSDIPRNYRQFRKRDCATFNYFYAQAEAAGKPIDSARAVYVPTSEKRRVWKGSWIYAEAHIQICVRNQRNILAIWHVRPDGRYGKPATSAGGIERPV